MVKNMIACIPTIIMSDIRQKSFILEDYAMNLYGKVEMQALLPDLQMIIVDFTHSLGLVLLNLFGI